MGKPWHIPVTQEIKSSNDIDDLDDGILDYGLDRGDRAP